MGNAPTKYKMLASEELNEKLPQLVINQPIERSMIVNSLQIHNNELVITTSVVSCSRSARTLYRAEPTRLLVHYIEQTLSTTRH